MRGAPGARRLAGAWSCRNRCGRPAPRTPPLRFPATRGAKHRARRNVYRYFRNEFLWGKKPPASPGGLENGTFTLRAQRSASHEIAQHLLCARAFLSVFFLGYGARLMAQFQPKEPLLKRTQTRADGGVHAAKTRGTFRASTYWRSCR